MSDLDERLARVRLLCLDVDGVLTSAHLYWAPGPIWSQRFSVRDGIGIKLLLAAGIEVAILSGGEIQSGRDRAASLGIRHAYFGLKDKLATFCELSRTLDIAPTETAFIGDELEDIALLRHVGFSATVPDAVDEVRAVVHYITQRQGGDGAVRELTDLLRSRRS